MRETISRFFGTAALALGVTLAGCEGPEAPAPAGEQLDATRGDTELRLVTPSARELLPEDARAAILQAVEARDDLRGPVSLISLRWEGTWALGTLTTTDLSAPVPDGEESHLMFESLYSLVLVRTERGWRAAIEGDSHAEALLEHVPESGLAPEARAAMFLKDGPRQQAVQAQAYSGYKFFWPANVDYRTTQPWHDPSTWSNRYPANTSLDFAIAGGGNSDILAGAPGTVTHMCDDGTQVLVGITTSGTTERLGYLHLDRASVVGAGIYEGKVVSTGTKLGRMLFSTSSGVVTNCGRSYGTHLHMYLPYRNITIDGKTFTDSNVHIGVSLWSSQGTPPPTSEVIVDNTSSGFTRYGPPEYWYTGNVGYGGTVTYTYANGSTVSNYARWKPVLPSAGNYTVYAYIPSNYASSQQASYRIFHNGVNNYATVNQNIHSNVWVSLGVHYFSANGTEYVELTDATGEALSLSRMIGFDALRFVK
jgi:hypothetical protein